ncbi:MAG: cytochrome c [Alphaproteobacteria bacterium]|nr:cytochrome c [Alphaproteobacteria bacterium]
MARAAAVIALGCLLGWAGLAHGEPSEARRDVLLHRLKHDCGSCHGMTLKGGHGPPLIPSQIAGKSDEDLAVVIRKGLPGTPMPPWDFEISRDEALWLVHQLREGTHAGR